MSKKKKVSYPYSEKGTHLTVITHEDGKTELIWDDEALLREVIEATKEGKKKKRKE
jgi:hypothetical protein